MTTLENVLKNKDLVWLLNNSEITNNFEDCRMTFFSANLPTKMLNNLRNWFDENGGSKCGGTVKVGLGSVNLYTSKWKGNNKVTFTTCLAK